MQDPLPAGSNSEPTDEPGAPEEAPAEPRQAAPRPSANMPSMVKLLVINLCALGIVLALMMPWIYLDIGTEDEDVTAAYDGRLQRMDTPEEDDGAPEDMGASLAGAGYQKVEEHYDRGLAIAGFILLLIIMGAAVFLRLVDVLPPRLGRGLQVLLTGVALLPAAMATVAGMRFIGGFGIAYDSMLDAADVGGTVTAYGAIAVAVIGLLALALLVLELLRDFTATWSGRLTGIWLWKGPLSQRLLLGTVVLAVVGIALVPVTPWMTVDPEEEDMGEFYQDAGLIHGRAEASDTGSEEARDLRRDVRFASAFFWLALVFAVAGLVAHALRNLGAPGAASKTVLLVGSMGFLFPLFGLMAHVGFMGHLKDLEISMGEGELAFAGFAPMVVAFLLLLFTVVYLAVAARDLAGRAPAAPEPALAPAEGPAGLPTVEQRPIVVPAAEEDVGDEAAGIYPPLATDEGPETGGDEEPKGGEADD